MDKPALISLTFDDGLRCQLKSGVPILDKYDLPATFFLTANTWPIHKDGCSHPDWPKVEWNEDDVQFLRSMIQRGHEIGSHSVNHKNPDFPNLNFNLNFDPKDEAEKSKRLIESWLGGEIPSFCYPFCKKPHALKSAVTAAGYRQARAGHGGHSYYSAQDSLDWFDVDCRLISENENVDGWMRPGCWHILMFHGIGTINDGWRPISVPEFTRQMTELAKHRDSGVVEVVTFKEGADRLRRPK